MELEEVTVEEGSDGGVEGGERETVVAELEEVATEEGVDGGVEGGERG